MTESELIVMASPQVELAKKTIETYIKEMKILLVPENVPPDMRERAGVFVSIKKRGELRGCIGTFTPTKMSIAEEIITNAIAAATQDPRFPPIEEAELSELEINVDVLSQPEKVFSKNDLDEKKYGVIVSAGGRKGLLLPDLPGVNSPAEQIAICMRKAGIGENEAVELYRFEVKRYY